MFDKNTSIELEYRNEILTSTLHQLLICLSLIFFAVCLLIKMMWFLLRIFCVIFCCGNVEITYSQDIVGCGGFIKSEVEINFSVIEVCTQHIPPPSSVSIGE